MKRKSLLVFLGALIVVAGAWTVGSAQDTQQVQPQDFNPMNPDDYPVLTNIDINIRGITNIGKIYMLEGIENETQVIGGGDTFDAGGTNYSRLVLHGVFDEDIRDWREEVIKNDFDKNQIEMDLYNSSGRRVLRITFYNAWPSKFSIPPFSIDANTRYMERLELVYDRFEITDS